MAPRTSIGSFENPADYFAFVLRVTVSDVHSVFQNELAADIPVVKTSIAGTRLVGRMTTGARPSICMLRHSANTDV